MTEEQVAEFIADTYDLQLWFVAFAAKWSKYKTVEGLSEEQKARIDAAVESFIAAVDSVIN